MRTAQCRTGSVTLQLLDAMELSEVLDYLHDWLQTASPAVHDDLQRFGRHDKATQVVQRALTTFSQLLVFGEADNDHTHDDDSDDHGPNGDAGQDRW